MGGPFMQGIVLMGIIYWYSKGMLNLINDYYRSEFRTKLKNAPPEQKAHLENAPSYDVEDMEQLIELEKLTDRLVRSKSIQMNQEEVAREWQSFRDAESSEGVSHCQRRKRKWEFWMLLNDWNILVKARGMDKSFGYPICMANGTMPYQIFF